MPNARTLPGRPLIDYVIRRYGLIEERLTEGVDYRSERGRWMSDRFATCGTLARYLGVTADTVRHWRDGKGVQVWKADQIAVEALGVHPSAIWPEDWWTIKNAKDPDNAYHERSKRKVPPPLRVRLVLNHERQEVAL